MLGTGSKSMPFFSVVIPCFNREKMVGDALDSVLQQTFSDYEIIVVDDGSTDRTDEVVAQYSGQVKYCKQENAGVAAARNRGISLASGDYICYLDSDDVWPNDKLEIYYQAIDRYPSCPFLFSNFRKHNIKLESPYELTNTDMFSFLYDYMELAHDCFYLLSGRKKLAALLHGYPLYPSTFVVRSDVHDNFRWDPGILKSEDFNFVLRMSSKHDLLYIDRDLATVRVHDSNKSADFLSKNSTNLKSMNLYRDLYAKDTEVGLCNYYISKRLFADGRAYLKHRLYRLGFPLIIRSFTYAENWSRLMSVFWRKFSGR